MKVVLNLLLRYCLQTENLHLSDLDRIVFYDKPLIKFERLLETYMSYSPGGFSSQLVSSEAPPAPPP